MACRSCDSGGAQALDLLGQVITSQQFTIIAVLNDARLSGDVARREIFSNWDVSNATTSVFLGTTNDDPTRVRLSDNFGGTDPPYDQQGAGPLDNPATHFILTGLSGAADALQFQNSSLIASLGAALSPRGLDTAYGIGKQGTLTDENWIGDLAELRIYDEALGNDELQRSLDRVRDSLWHRGARAVKCDPRRNRRTRHRRAETPH